jgi:ABC-type lipoprotein export system ATPase subunit
MLVTNDPRGSLWRKWDLHIHSPASFHWNGAKLTGNRTTDDVLLTEMVKAINDAPADAFCIMDYWHLDGWFALQEFITRTNPEIKKKIFPGIELRLEAYTKHRLNTHFLFDDALSTQKLRDFLALLKIGGGRIERSPSKEAFAEVAQLYGDDKLITAGLKPEDRTNEDEMARLGMMSAEVTRDSWRAAKDFLGDRALIIQPFDTNDGLAKLDWKSHLYDATELMLAPDFFETRNATAISLLQGPGHPTKPEVTANFLQSIGGKHKPAICGSDAHSFDKYGAFHNGKVCWIKADLSFAGLRQCTIDPIGRVYIGDEPLKLRHKRENKTKYIDSIQIRKEQGSFLSEKWFDTNIVLNPGMCAIFGNKGTGKSALADIIALAGNSHCPSFEFLNSKRFRKISENKASHFSATIVWDNGDKVSVRLNDDTDNTKPERVRYLPQQYLEQLCTDIGVQGTNRFEAELKKVIFSHTPTHLKLGQESLDQVISFQTEQIKKRINLLQKELSDVNIGITSIERDTRAENINTITNQLDYKNSELLTHAKNSPTLAPLPSNLDESTAKVTQQINSIRNSIETTERLVAAQRILQNQNTAALSSANRLTQNLRNIAANIENDIEGIITDAKAINVDYKSLVTYKVDYEAVSIIEQSLQGKANELASNIATLQQQLVALEVEFSALQDKASEADRLYQKSLEDFKDWERIRENIIGDKVSVGSITYLQNKLDYLTNNAPIVLSHLVENRVHIVGEIFNEILKQVSIYKELYGPIEIAIAKHDFIRANIKLGFDAVLEATDFASNFLAMLNLGRRGTFYGQSDGLDAVRKIVQQYNFNNWHEVEKFLFSIVASLTKDKRASGNNDVEIKNQLRDTVNIEDIYDFVFGLSYIKPRITLQLAGKELEELSPGERGILLLVFYLLLDQEETPLIIDQPEHNLDNSSVFHLLEPCIRYAKQHRQIILVTHNPNVAVVCDAEQVIFAEIDKQDGHKVTYTSGAIENGILNLSVVDILEGTWPAFTIRDTAYQRTNS